MSGWWNWVSEPENFRYFVAPLLTPLLVIIGWFVVSRDNDRRETRKEIRAQLNELAQRLDALTNSAVTYYCDTQNTDRNSAVTLEIQLKQGLERLAMNISSIGRIEPSFEEAHDVLDKLYTAITGHQKFESRTYGGTLARDDEAVLSIALRSAQLLNDLDEIYVMTQIKR